MVKTLIDSVKSGKFVAKIIFTCNCVIYLLCNLDAHYEIWNQEPLTIVPIRALKTKFRRTF